MSFRSGVRSVLALGALAANPPHPGSAQAADARLLAVPRPETVNCVENSRASRPGQPTGLTLYRYHIGVPQFQIRIPEDRTVLTGSPPRVTVAVFDQQGTLLALVDSVFTRWSIWTAVLELDPTSRSESYIQGSVVDSAEVMDIARRLGPARLREAAGRVMFVVSGQAGSGEQLGKLLPALRAKRVAIPWLLSAGACGVALWAAVRLDSLPLDGAGRTGWLTVLILSSLAAFGCIGLAMGLLRRARRRLGRLLERLRPRLLEVSGRDLTAEPTRLLMGVYRDLCALEQEVRTAGLPRFDRFELAEWVAVQKKPLEAVLRRRHVLKVEALLLAVLLLLAPRDGRAQPATYVPLPAPVLSIGHEGDPDYEFSSVAAAFRLSTGEIVVADWGTPYLRVFDQSGQLLRRLGRQGSGPGEFRSVHTLLVVGDTLVVYDWNTLRLTRYLASGRLLGTQPVQTTSDYGTTHVIEHLPSNRWLVATPHSPDWNHGPGLYRDSLHIGVVPLSSTGRVRWIGHFPGAMFYAYMPGQEKGRWVVGWAFFAPNTILGVSGDTVITGDTSTPELQYVSADGQVVRRVSLPLGRAPDLAPHRSAALIDALAEAGPQGNTDYLRAAYEAARPAVYYRDFVVATNGELWVRLFEPRPGDRVPYLILSPAGAVRARVSLPPRGRVLAVEPAWITCVVADADGVERVSFVRWSVP